MIKLTYKKIEQKDEDQLRKLIADVLSETPDEFFIPYEQWELNSLFDESYAPLYGAYDGDILAGSAQLYVQQEMLQEYKEELGLADKKVCELGGNLVSKDYRGRGIQYKLMKMQCGLARELGFDYIMTMAHPENTASLKNIQKLGLTFVKQTRLSNGFLRDLYCSERLDQKLKT